jgi:hypothetical protein
VARLQLQPILRLKLIQLRFNLPKLLTLAARDCKIVD